MHFVFARAYLSGHLAVAPKTDQVVHGENDQWDIEPFARARTLIVNPRVARPPPKAPQPPGRASRGEPWPKAGAFLRLKAWATSVGAIGDDAGWACRGSWVWPRAGNG
jgi:hypothetical protein